MLDVLRRGPQLGAVEPTLTPQRRCKAVVVRDVVPAGEEHVRSTPQRLDPPHERPHEPGAVDQDVPALPNQEVAGGAVAVLVVVPAVVDRSA